MQRSAASCSHYRMTTTRTASVCITALPASTPQQAQVPCLPLILDIMPSVYLKLLSSLQASSAALSSHQMSQAAQGPISCTIGCQLDINFAILAVL
jgi:hypothetical protein